LATIIGWVGEVIREKENPNSKNIYNWVRIPT